MSKLQACVVKFVLLLELEMLFMYKKMKKVKYIRYIYSINIYICRHMCNF